MPDRPPAVLLVGHGTHSPRGQASFLKLAELLAARLAPTPVEPAFLEIAEPTIAAGVANLVRRDARQVVVLPVLLFAAGHAKRDIPQAVAKAAEALPLEFCQGEHLGCDPLLVELSRRQFTEALQDREPISPAETCLLLVGRGSPDESATAEMLEFARMRSEAERSVAPPGLWPAGHPAHVEVAFLAKAQPRVSDLLPRLAASQYRQVVVQPHLLFHGDLLQSLAAQVSAVAASHPGQEWLLAPILADDLGQGGPVDDLLVRVLASRYHAAAIRIVAKSGQG